MMKLSRGPSHGSQERAPKGASLRRTSTLLQGRGAALVVVADVHPQKPAIIVRIVRCPGVAVDRLRVRDSITGHIEGVGSAVVAGAEREPDHASLDQLADGL